MPNREVSTQSRTTNHIGASIPGTKSGLDELTGNGPRRTADYVQSIERPREDKSGSNELKYSHRGYY